jgi:hypothetical protein
MLDKLPMMCYYGLDALPKDKTNRQRQYNERPADRRLTDTQSERKSHGQSKRTQHTDKAEPSGFCAIRTNRKK